ncbi:hypothetical protein BGZ94_001986 [Podila epigama]|nr:hypothetical protein BGZ94_001986 [Podila epigama]
MLSVTHRSLITRPIIITTKPSTFLDPRSHRDKEPHEKTSYGLRPCQTKNLLTRKCDNVPEAKTGEDTQDGKGIESDAKGNASFCPTLRDEGGVRGME